MIEIVSTENVQGVDIERPVFAHRPESGLALWFLENVGYLVGLFVIKYLDDEVMAPKNGRGRMRRKKIQ